MLSRVCDECLPHWPPGATTLTVVNIPVIIPSTCDHCGSYGPVCLMQSVLVHIEPKEITDEAMDQELHPMTKSNWTPPHEPMTAEQIYHAMTDHLNPEDLHETALPPV